jgi:hypothetical protein
VQQRDALERVRLLRELAREAKVRLHRRRRPVPALRVASLRVGGAAPQTRLSDGVPWATASPTQRAKGCESDGPWTIGRIPNGRRLVRVTLGAEFDLKLQ